MRRMPSYRKTTAENSNRDLGNAFSLATDQMARSDTDFGTPSTDKTAVVFNELTMHKTTERPIHVRRVIFSEMPTLHEGPTHNTRSVSLVTENSRTESTDSAQLNDSAFDHPTLILGATSPVIPHRSERLSQPPERYCLRIFFTNAGEQTSYEEASAAADSATWHLAM